MNFWRWIIVAAIILLLAWGFVLKAHADGDWPLLVTAPSGQGAFYFPTGPAVNTTGDQSIEFALVSGDTPLNIGLPSRPWRNVYVQNKVSAASFVANGSPGINAVLHVGQCVLTIQGGLIVSAVIPPVNQPCP